MRHANDSGRVQLAPVRRGKIIELLSAQRFVTNTQIRDTIGASAATVRRDLHLLERQGRLLRVRGGAVLVPDRPAPPAAKRPAGGTDEIVEDIVRALATLMKAGDVRKAEQALRQALESCGRVNAGTPLAGAGRER